MKINTVNNSNITENGDIIKPTTIIDNRKFYQTKTFWGGFVSGFILPILVNYVWEFIIKPLL